MGYFIIRHSLFEILRFNCIPRIYSFFRSFPTISSAHSDGVCEADQHARGRTANRTLCHCYLGRMQLTSRTGTRRASDYVIPLSGSYSLQKGGES